LTVEQNAEIQKELVASGLVYERDQVAIESQSPAMSAEEKASALKKAKGRWYARNNSLRRKFGVPIQENRQRFRNSLPKSQDSPSAVTIAPRRRGRPSDSDNTNTPVLAPQSNAFRPPQASMMDQAPPTDGMPRPNWLGYLSPSSAANSPSNTTASTPQVENALQTKRPSISGPDSSEKRKNSEDGRNGSEKRKRMSDHLGDAQLKWESIRGSKSDTPSKPVSNENSRPTSSHVAANTVSGKGSSVKNSVFIASSAEDSTTDDSSDGDIPHVRPRTSSSGKMGLLDPPRNIAMRGKGMARRGGGRPHGSLGRRG
jgi:hypothetical protein